MLPIGERMHKLIKMWITIVSLYSFVWIVVLAGYGAGMFGLPWGLWEWMEANVFIVPVLLAATLLIYLLGRLWYK